MQGLSTSVQLPQHIYVIDEGVQPPETQSQREPFESLYTELAGQLDIEPGETRDWLLSQIRRTAPHVPQSFFNAGFVVGLVIAASILAATVIYLMVFVGIATYGIVTLTDLSPPVVATTSTPDGQPTVDTAGENVPWRESTLKLGVVARLMMVKMTLLSCGVFVGLALGSFGFSLFLLGVRGDMDVEAHREEMRVKIVRLAPGAFLLLCAAVLVGICVTSQFSLASDDILSVSAADESTESESDESSEQATVGQAQSAKTTLLALFSGESKKLFAEFAREVINVGSREVRDPVGKMNQLAKAAQYLGDAYRNERIQLDSIIGQFPEKDDDIQQRIKQLRDIEQALAFLDGMQIDTEEDAKKASRDFETKSRAKQLIE